MLNPETLKILDPACGSGHILVEAYDILKDIYLERGYRLRDIPRLILEKNIFGLDIDDRAAQLAGFALLMKARADDRRILDNPPKLNILSLQSSEKIKLPLLWHHLNLYQKSKVGATSSLFEEPQLDLTNALELQQYSMVQDIVILFEQAKTFGALIQIPRDYAEAIAELLAQCQQLAVNGDNLQKIAATTLMPFLEQAKILTMQFDVVVANPPYMGGKGMNPALKEFAKKQFPDSKSDLFAMFIERGFAWCKASGFNAQVTMQSWMFLSSYEAMREKLLKERTLSCMVHMGNGVMGIAFGTAATIFTNQHINDYAGSFSYCDNDDLNDNGIPAHFPVQNERLKTAKPDDFKKISGSPVAYWVSDNAIKCFLERKVHELTISDGQNKTGNNGKFVRLWWETKKNDVGVGNKWILYAKGGDFRRWFGNLDNVIDWSESARKHYRSDLSSRIIPEYLWNKIGITWTLLTASRQSFRVLPENATFDMTGSSVFLKDEQDLNLLLSFLNSCVADMYMSLLNPTLALQIRDVRNLPLPKIKNEKIEINTQDLTKSSKTDWNNYETSWDFTENPLIRQLSGELIVASGEKKTNHLTLATCYSRWQTQNRAAIVEMKRLEEENNRLFIEAYGLQDELSPDVPEEQITLVRADREKDSQRLISYAIGCMMGRYSLDEAGLIYAGKSSPLFEGGLGGISQLADVESGRLNQEQIPPAPLQKGGDLHGIVPITDEFWFEDDAAQRLNDFFQTVWGADTLETNKTWLAENLGVKNNETADETLRRYLANHFYKTHLQTYKKRPIYWCFSSGKQGAFQALVYLHRFNDSTLARMRNNYVVPLMSKMQNRIEMLEKDSDAATSPASKNKIGKEIERFNKKKIELTAFDEKLRHYADMRISLDLDDGVKVNYGKFGDLLAEVKAVTGGSGDE